MGYYMDILFKSNYETYQELLEFIVEFAKDWQYRKYLNPNDVINKEYIEDLLEDDVFYDERGDICIKSCVKYGTLIQKGIEEFTKKLIDENREEDFTLAEAGEEYDDYGVKGEYDLDVDVYVYKEIEPALRKPKKLKKGNLFIKIEI